MSQQDTLRRGALRYHMQEDRQSTCGSMALDMDLILSGLVEIGTDSRLYVTEKGHAFLASGMEARQGGDGTAPSRSDDSPARRGRPTPIEDRKS